MDLQERINRQKELIERMGRFYEKEGLQPTSGRILSLLMVMDKEEFTFDEIVEQLQISKSSASNAITLLETRDAIEYFTKPGDRKRYFRIKKLDKFRLIDEHRIRLKMINTFFTDVLELKARKDSDNALFIIDLISMLNFFLDKFDELKKEFIDGNKP